MKQNESTRGQSLLEILFAVALFVLGIVTIAFLIFDANVSLRQSIESYQASLLAGEGIEAVRSIGRDDFDSVASGTHSLAISEGRWVLSTSTDSTGKFSRTITVEDIDLETKKITSEIVFVPSGVREKRISLSTYLTDWEASGGNAGALDIDHDGVSLTSSSTNLTGIRIQNTSGTTITLVGMTLQWDAPAELYRITLSGSDIFLVSTSSGVTSGTYIDTTDHVLGAYSGFQTIDRFLFTDSVAGSEVITTYVFSDGSRRHALLAL